MTQLYLSINQKLIDSLSELLYFANEDETYTFTDSVDNRDMLSDLLNRHAALSLVSMINKLVKHRKSERAFELDSFEAESLAALEKSLALALEALRYEASNAMHISIGLVNESVITQVDAMMNTIFAQDVDSIIERVSTLFFDIANVY